MIKPLSYHYNQIVSITLYNQKKRRRLRKKIYNFMLIEIVVEYFKSCQNESHL